MGIGLGWGTTRGRRGGEKEEGNDAEMARESKHNGGIGVAFVESNGSPYQKGRSSCQDDRVEVKQKGGMVEEQRKREETKEREGENKLRPDRVRNRESCKKPD